VLRWQQCHPSQKLPCICCCKRPLLCLHCFVHLPLMTLQAWQDERHLLVGTKCNKLLQWDTVGGSLRSVPLPPIAERQHPVVETQWGSCGIHSVCVNPAGDLVATGGEEPADCVVLRLPDFKPVQTLVVGAARWRQDPASAAHAGCHRSRAGGRYGCLCRHLCQALAAAAASSLLSVGLISAVHNALCHACSLSTR
jgi:hypothetical protein